MLHGCSFVPFSLNTTITAASTNTHTNTSIKNPLFPYFSVQVSIDDDEKAGFFEVNFLVKIPHFLSQHKHKVEVCLHIFNHTYIKSVLKCTYIQGLNRRGRKKVRLEQKRWRIGAGEHKKTDKIKNINIVCTVFSYIFCQFEENVFIFIIAYIHTYLSVDCS